MGRRRAAEPTLTALQTFPERRVAASDEVLLAAKSSWPFLSYTSKVVAEKACGSSCRFPKDLSSMGGAINTTDVVIVNYGRADDVVSAVASLDGAPCQSIIVVDNSVAEGQAAELRLLAQRNGRVDLVVSPENLGFGRACNLAFERSGAETLLLLNPDARLRAGALQTLRNTLSSDSKLAGVAPRIDWTSEGDLVLPNLTAQSPISRIEQALACRFAKYAPKWFERRGERHALATRELMRRQEPFSVTALSGSILLLRRRSILELGTLFDPAYFMYFEDTDLSERLRKNGWRLCIEPRARGWHMWHNSPDKDGHMSRSERIFLKRHYPISDRLQQWLVPRIFADPWRNRENTSTVAKTFEECRKLLGPFWAITPLPMLHPAGVRCGDAPLPLSMEEWNLLDNGRWFALVDAEGGRQSRYWKSCSIDRVLT